MRHFQVHLAMLRWRARDWQFGGQQPLRCPICEPTIVELPVAEVFTRTAAAATCWAAKLAVARATRCGHPLSSPPQWLEHWRHAALPSRHGPVHPSAWPAPTCCLPLALDWCSGVQQRGAATGQSLLGQRSRCWQQPSTTSPAACWPSLDSLQPSGGRCTQQGTGTG